MKILVFASCSNTKAIKYPNQPTCSELQTKEMREKVINYFPEKREAKNLYRGALNISVTSAVKQLKEFFEVNYYIVSAGFGIIRSNDIIPPYDCTFSNMNKQQIIERGQLLEIPEDFIKIIKLEQPDMIYLALGKNYMTALGEWDNNLPCKTIAFTDSESEKVITLPADHIIVHQVSRVSGLPIHGVVGFKGDLLLLTVRYLKNQKEPVKALEEILNAPDDLIYTINTLREHSY
ncbi:MAG: DUF6884 domain-containing protein [Candidatus Heimdallarchaeota archaeon]